MHTSAKFKGRAKKQVSLNTEQGDACQDASGYCQCCSPDQGFFIFKEILHDHDSLKLARQ